MDQLDLCLYISVCDAACVYVECKLGIKSVSWFIIDQNVMFVDGFVFSIGKLTGCWATGVLIDLLDYDISLISVCEFFCAKSLG